MRRKSCAEKLAYKSRQIEEGKLKDDYENYFLSHFGFYDVPPTLNQPLK